MTKLLRSLPILSISLLSLVTAKAQKFTPGNLAVLLVSDATKNSTGSIVELTTTATSAQTPVTNPNVGGLFFSGGATSTGYLANSNDGGFLCVTGATTSASNVNTVLKRGVVILDINQALSLAAVYTGVSGEQTRCATTTDNTNYFIADQEGLYTNGATSPGIIGNFRQTKAFGNIVYASASSVVSTVSGTTLTNLPNVGAITNLTDFYLIQSGSNGTTFDILYAVTSSSETAGTIAKYSLLNDGTWDANGSYTTNFGGYAIAAKTITTGQAELYVSTGQGDITNNLLKLTDISGFDQTINISATPTTLYTATSPTIVKGIAFAPTGTLTATPTTVSLSVSTSKASESAKTVVTVTATASAPVLGNQTVALTATNHEGVTSDFTLSSNTITIPGGATTGTATFTVVDDNAVEGLEVDTLQISNPSSGIILGTTTTQLITIQDNDASPTGMRITEYMYSGGNGEFAEFTNIGTTPIDMTGWSYDDNAATPGAVSLSNFGIVKPGESVILTETDAALFRTDWTLCPGQPVIGGNTDNLGRSDQINLYDNKGHLVDRLTYGDQVFPGTIRTQNVSGYVSTAALGVDSIAGWKLSVVGDAEQSTKSAGNDIGSPGKSTMATVTFDACFVDPNAPTIAVDVNSTSNFIDQGAITSPTSPYTISSVIGDPQDPVSTLGFYFTINGGSTPVNQLTVTAWSSNETVVPAANLILTGGAASRNLLVIPAAVGYASITVTVRSATDSSSFVIDYAASNPAFTAASSSVTWPTGSSDASAAYGLDDQYMVIGDDQQNRLLVYNRAASGLPVTTFDYTTGNNLGLTDGTAPNYKQVDVEMSATSPVTPGRTYWSGSMANSSSSPYALAANRDRTFRVDVSGTGAATQFTFGGYTALRQQLITWGDNNGYNFSASAAAGSNPKTISGFNLEGMVFAPDNTTLYMGFRAPLVPTATRTNAVIAPILNFESWFNNGAPTGNATLGAPIELDLGGRGIRDMIRLTNGLYVIAAGSYDGTSNPALYTWTGNIGDVPAQATSFDVTGQNPEALVQMNQSGQLSLDQLQVISDDGATAFYNDGIEAKDLPEVNWQKFSSAIVTSTDPVALPLVFIAFTAERQIPNALLNWTTGVPGSLASFTVQRSADGAIYTDVATVPAFAPQTAYTYTDGNAPATRLYYRIRANELSGQTVLSTIRALDAGNSALPIQVYPNPVVNGTFTLAIPGTTQKTVSIYSSTGALIRQQSFTDTAKDFSTTGWAKGFYLLRIVTADGTTTTQKLIVQ